MPDSIPEYYWWITIVICILLACLTVQQIIISPLPQTGSLFARIAVLIILILELSILLLEYFTIVKHDMPDPAIANPAFALSLFWTLVWFRSYSIYKVVHPPKLYEHKVEYQPTWH